MTTATRPDSTTVSQTLRRFKMHKRTFEDRLQAVREERDDLRHLVAVPVNPRARQQTLLDEEKDSRLVEIFAKVNSGLYFQKDVAGEIGERLLSKLWEMNF